MELKKWYVWDYCSLLFEGQFSELRNSENIRQVPKDLQITLVWPLKKRLLKNVITGSRCDSSWLSICRGTLSLRSCGISKTQKIHFLGQRLQVLGERATWIYVLSETIGSLCLISCEVNEESAKKLCEVKNVWDMGWEKMTLSYRKDH